MPVRASISLRVEVDGAATASETRYTRAGPYVLTIATVLPRSDLAVELHSTYMGHPKLPTRATHLRLAIRDVRPAIHAPDQRDVDVVCSPRDCVYDHSLRLIDYLGELGHQAVVKIDEATFVDLEIAD
jgi:hypothetical protein